MPILSLECKSSSSPHLQHTLPSIISKSSDNSSALPCSASRLPVLGLGGEGGIPFSLAKRCCSLRRRSPWWVESKHSNWSKPPSHTGCRPRTSSFPVFSEGLSTPHYCTQGRGDHPTVKDFDSKVTQHRFGQRRASGDAAICRHEKLGMLDSVSGMEAALCNRGLE